MAADTNGRSCAGLAAQEYAEDAVSCFRASGECVFDMEAIEQAVGGVRGASGVAGQRTADDLASAAARGRQYIIGVDPAGGGSEGDYACAQVIERQTGIAVRGVAWTLSSV